MKLLKLDSSLSARKQLAQELGYKGATGSAEMNIWLHKQVMTKLAKTGGVVPENLKQAPSPADAAHEPKKRTMGIFSKIVTAGVSSDGGEGFVCAQGWSCAADANKARHWDRRSDTRVSEGRIARRANDWALSPRSLSF